MKDKDLALKQNNELISNEAIDSLVSYAPEHREMITTIKESLPEIQRATSLFYKSQSQFMDTMLTVSHPTPLRNLRQILSEMNRTKTALKENHFKVKRKEIKIKLLEEKLKKESNKHKKDLIELNIMEYYSQIEDIKGYMSGALRKLTNYTEQYNSILSTMGVENFNEIDFEKEEERYHIMKAFEQALNASRSRNGLIDEGNMIYFTQIGINGGAAQKDIYTYLAEEGKLLANGEEPSHKMTLNFLNKMADKYSGVSKSYAKYKGMTGEITEKAALKKGDTRLLELQGASKE